MTDETASPSPLISVGLRELDSNGDVLWTWSYPALANTLRQVVERKAPLSKETLQGEPTCVFSRFRSTWWYETTVAVPEETALEGIQALSLVIVAKDHHPEKYQALSKHFLDKYASCKCWLQL